MKPFQVKISIKRDKYKAQVLSGVVIAQNQLTAVSIAMENTKKQIEAGKLEMTAKLLSAYPLGSSFIYIEQVAEKTP